MNRLMESLPAFYREIREFQELLLVETEQLDLLDVAAKKVEDDQFIMTSSESAVLRREKMFRIVPDPTVETLDFRKKRIINRQTIKPPFTIRYLQERLDFLLGEGMATIRVDVDNYILYVELETSDAAMFAELGSTVERIVPLNLIYLQKTTLQDGIIFEEEMYKIRLVRTTRLSTSWKLGRTAFMDLGSKEKVSRDPLHRATKLSNGWRLGITPFVKQGAG